ncbi:hypothetical protein FXF51_54455 [Nonomuraea sp. PA05]|uniref:hypothetical protein n=1 Tax=Nonomuraea sp. PA05 TaxID=2604466 RepID=UPI0011D6E736|nr:hypothetical protein [Nonomuraea sp. PA05]TYB51038.1 hypothetical protein FXF51_54455 [Nonomuraea sp. PA05]
MRRALRYAAIWCGATVVAVSVSWFGVRGVLRNEFVDDVDVEPFLAQTIAADERPATRPPATRPPATRPDATGPHATPTASATREVPKRSRTPAPATERQATPSLKVVKVKGGEVAFTLGPAGCRLVSATPVSGYTAKIARADGWIRVDLAKGEHGTAVFCIGHEQRTDTWEY